jgi:hypothetical protein
VYFGAIKDDIKMPIVLQKENRKKKRSQNGLKKFNARVASQSQESAANRSTNCPFDRISTDASIIVYKCPFFDRGHCFKSVAHARQASRRR